MASRSSRSLRPPLATRLARGGVIALVLAALVWTTLWFAGAGWVKSEFDDRTRQLAREARADIECGRRDVTGFPFSFHFVCDENVMVDTDRAELAFTGLDAGTSVFSPSTFHASVDGPANVALAPSTTVIADWETAKTTVSDAFGRRRIEVQLEALSLDTPGVDATARDANLVLAPEATDLAIDFAANELTLTPPGRPQAAIPRIFLRAVLDGLHHRLLVRGRPFDPSAGLRGRIAGFGLNAEDRGRLLVSGPFEVSPDGLISGEFTIAMRDPDAVGAVLEQLIEDEGRIRAALSALQAMSLPRTIDGEEMRAIEVKAVNGNIPVLFTTIPLPRLWGPSPPSQ